MPSLASPPPHNNISFLMMFAPVWGLSNNPSPPAICHSHDITAIRKQPRSNQYISQWGRKDDFFHFILASHIEMYHPLLKAMARGCNEREWSYKCIAFLGWHKERSECEWPFLFYINIKLFYNS